MTSAKIEACGGGTWGGESGRVISEEDHQGSGRIPKAKTGGRKDMGRGWGAWVGCTADMLRPYLYPTHNKELLEFFSAAENSD